MDDIQTAYVLAGGQSRRMGCDKLFVEFEGCSLLAHVLDTCRQHFADVVIVAREVTKFASLGHDVVLDVDGFKGPIAGVIAALRDCRQAACFITAADLVDLAPDIITRLKSEYRGEDYLGLCDREYDQPLCGIYRADARPHIEAAAVRGVQSVRAALQSLCVRYLDAPAVWRNINRPVDLVKGVSND